MKSRYFIFAIGCITLLPLSSVRAGGSLGRPIPYSSTATAQEVSYEVIVGDGIRSGGEVVPQGCSSCSDRGVATAFCEDGVDCGFGDCQSCGPCGSPLGECNATCFTPQIKRRLYKIPCATGCGECPPVGSVLVEALGALRLHLWELKQTGFPRRCNDGCFDTSCTIDMCDTGVCGRLGGGRFLSSGGLFGRFFGTPIYVEDCGVERGGSLNCTSCGSACGGYCGGDCGVGFLGGGRLANFLVACRGRLAQPWTPGGRGGYWAQFDEGCVGGGCGGGGCADEGWERADATDATEPLEPSPAASLPASRASRLQGDANARFMPRGGLVGFLFPQAKQSRFSTISSQRFGQRTRTALGRPTANNRVLGLEENVQIVSTQDRRVGESAVPSGQRQLNHHRVSVAATPRGRVVQGQASQELPVSRVGYESQQRRHSGVKRTTSSPSFFAR